MLGTAHHIKNGRVGGRWCGMVRWLHALFLSAVLLLRFMVPHVLRIALLSALPNGKRVSVYNLDSRIKKHPEWIREDLGVLLNLLSQGEIAPIIGKRLPLQEIIKAHELLEHGQVQGKLVLLPNS